MFGMMVISNAGAALVRKAASGSKKLVFTRAKSGSQWDDSRADLANKPANWYDGIEGTISGVSAGSDGLKVVASFTAADSGDLPVKSVCICAQLKKDGVDPEYDEADDVIFAAWCDDNSAYVSGDAISIKFDLPIALSSLVDDSGSTSGDFVTLDTEQTITGAKTFVNKLVCLAGEDSIKIEEGLKVYNSADESNGTPYIIFASSGGAVVDSNGDEVGFEYAAMPVEAAYSTANKTIDLTLGDGTVVRLTCTNVEENPA